MTIENQPSDANCWAIVPAAGIGSRMQSSKPKQYLELAGRPLIEHCLLRFLEADWIKGIVVAISEKDAYWHQLPVSNNPKIITTIGGEERLHSVSNGLAAIQEQLQDNDFVLVHDAARPCLSTSDLQLLQQSLVDAKDGVLLADKITDTVKRDDGESLILKTVPRAGLWRALTPQLFPHQVLTRALSHVAKDESLSITDEASAVEQLGLSPRLIQGRSDNIKVTKASDIQMASLILQLHREQDI